MRRYKVYRQGTEYRALKEGWCWPALLFGVLWALWARLWKPIMIAMLVIVPIELLEHLIAIPGSPAEIFFAFVELGLVRFFGAKGNEWRAESLEEDGYDLVRRVEATSAGEATALVELAEARARRRGWHGQPEPGRGVALSASGLRRLDEVVNRRRRGAAPARQSSHGDSAGVLSLGEG